MKNNILFIFSLTVFCFYSCGDDFYKPDSGGDNKKYVNDIQMRDLDVSLAKELYEKRITKLALPEIGRKSNERIIDFDDPKYKDVPDSIKNNIQSHQNAPAPEINLEPDWDNCREWVDSICKYMEIPLLNTDRLMAHKRARNSENDTITEEYVGVQMILVMRQKHDGSMAFPFIVTLIGEEEYLRKKGDKIKDLLHKPNDNEFTGSVYYSSLNGKIINGHYYTNGKRTHFIYSAKDMPGVTLKKNEFKTHIKLVQKE